VVVRPRPSPPRCCYHHRNSGFFPCELSVVVPEIENDVLDEIHCLLGANLSQGPRLDPLSELLDHDEHVGQAPGRFHEGSQEV
jgi:hypothetical protein